MEELCIWSNTFASFKRCWEDYHSRKQYAAVKAKEKLFEARNKKLLYRDIKRDELNIAGGKLKARQVPAECYGMDSRISMDSNVRTIKSTPESNGNQSRLLDTTG